MHPPATSLGDLWSISPDSFRALLEPGLRRRVVQREPPRCPTGGDDLRLDDVLREYDCAHCRCDAAQASVDHAFRSVSQLMRGPGVYGLPALELPGCRSVRKLVDVPEPRPGDRVGRILELAIVDAPNVLVWRSIGPIDIFGHVLDALALYYGVLPACPGWTRLTFCLRVRAPGLTPSVCRYLIAALDLALIAPQLESARRLAELSATVNLGEGETGAPPAWSNRAAQGAQFLPAGKERRDAGRAD